MKPTIFKKILALSAFSAVSMSGIIFVTAMYFMSVEFEDASLGRLNSVRASVAHQIDTTLAKFLEEAALIAENDAFVREVASGDVAILQRRAAHIMKSTNADFATITDTQGKVLARGHAAQHGDSLANQSTVQRALKGEATTGIATGSASW